MEDPYEQARHELNKELKNLSEEEKAFLAKVVAGKIKTWKALEAAALVPYEAVLGTTARTEFQGFLRRVRMLYPKPQEAAIVLASNIYTASWLQPPNRPEDYFATALESPMRENGNPTVVTARKKDYPGGIRELPWPTGKSGTRTANTWGRYFRDLHRQDTNYKPTAMEIVELFYTAACEKKPLHIMGIGRIGLDVTYETFRSIGYELPQMNS